MNSAIYKSYNKQNNELNDNEQNPYAYLERDDFTSEKYKIEVRGLPKYYGIGEFKKLLSDKLELNLGKIKPPRRGSGWLYVCFKNEETRDQAITKINNISWKRCKLTAHVANPAPDPFIKRKIEESQIDCKKSKIDFNELNSTPEEQIKNSTIPLWQMPYDAQLKLKEEEIKSILLKLSSQIQKENKNITEWLTTQIKNNHGILCELSPILYSDVINGYRNKCEFSVGKSINAQQTMVGFRLSSYAAGSTAIGPIDELFHIPEKMKNVVKIIEEFIQSSELEPYNPVNHTGFWRQVTVRTTRLNHLMLIISINPQTLKDEDLTKLKFQLKHFFEKGKGVQAGVTSLYFETINTNSSRNVTEGKTLVHLSGTPYIEELLLGMTFRISPEAFFQVNTLGAEILYEAATKLVHPTKETSVLDICCGTGTIGLYFSKYCGEVLGLEVVANAIKDAKENVLKNNIDNCEFFIGKAEDILNPVIHRTTKPDIIAIVDPPRAGLHHKAVIALRRAKKLNRMLYISCDPKAAMKNLVDLARPNSKQYSGEPLVPVKAIPVDMFPHTKHCELIIYLERISNRSGS